MRHWITSAILFASLVASQAIAAQSNVAVAADRTADAGGSWE